MKNCFSNLFSTLKKSSGLLLLLHREATIFRFILTVIFSTLLILFPEVSPAQTSIKFKRFSQDQGLSMSDIRAIVQDKKGFIWVGTLDGLNKFDGYTFHVYKNNPNDAHSLSNNTIWALYVDTNGILYAGTDDGGLNVYDQDNDLFIHYIHDPKDESSIGANEVTSIFEDSKGVLWVGTDGGGLHIFDRETKKFTRLQHNPEDRNSVVSNVIRTINEDKNGNLWIGTNQGISLLDKERKNFLHFQHTPEDPGSLGTNDVLKIFVDSDKDIWIGTFHGLYLFNETHRNFLAYRSDIPERWIMSNYVPDIVEDNGKLWIACNFGINVLDKRTGTFTYHQHDPLNHFSLIENGMNTLYRDSMGNIWLGTFAGFCMKEAGDSNFLHYTYEPTNPSSLRMKEVQSFYQDKKGHIWVAGRVGIHEFDKNRNIFIHHLPFDESDFNKVSDSFYEDSKNNFWVASPSGLYLYDRATEKVEAFHDSNPGASNNFKIDIVWYIQEDPNKNLWIASLTKGVFRLDRSTKKFHPLKWEGKYIPNKDIFSFSIDKEGTFWIGTALEGLFQINKEKGIYEVYKTDKQIKNSISSNFILNTFEDSKGNFWVGTRGGLNLLDRKTKTFTSYTEVDGLLNGFINSILEDNEGNLWLGTNRGLSKFTPETKTFRNYTVDNGLQSNEFWHRSALKLASGELLFGGINGFNMFKPENLKDNSLIPNVLLTNFQLFNESVEINKDGSPLKKHISETKEIVLSHAQSTFSFNFVALNYIISKNNKYAYKLEGFDKAWNQVESQRKATYTNISPGEYLFRVKGSNNDGVWNEEGASVKLIITPPFWQTWWFRTLAGLFLLGSVFGTVRVRMNAIKAQKEKLEKQVKEKTADLSKAYKELTERQEEILQQQEEMEAQAEMMIQTNKNLEQVNEQVMSSIQYAQTIQKAILPSTKKIEQVFPEHFILYRPKDVVSGDFYWFAHLPKEESGLQTDISFMAVVDCTGHGVPGAFMSIIGSTILNEIVNQKQITDPATILELLNEGVKQAVEKTEGMNTAGMDVCLCQFVKGEGNQMRVLFSGAKRNLLFVRSGSKKLEKLVADRRSIGSNSPLPFTTQELILESGSMLYLTSDGYADQNNPAREKLGSSRLNATIKQYTHLSPVEQKKVFEEVLDQHQQDSEQRDDITLIGLKV